MRKITSNIASRISSSMNVCLSLTGLVSKDQSYASDRPQIWPWTG